MNRKIYSFLILSLAACLFFAACSKEGPTGPQGSPGPTGPVGPAGPAGPKGDSGTANVIYSDWIDVTYEAVTNDNGDTVGFDTNIPSNDLNSDIINGGVMHLYANLGTVANPDIVLLPYIDIFSGISLTPFFELNNIYVQSNVDASTVTIENEKYLQYRYVLIPGGVEGNAVVHPPDWKDYNAVKKFYHLPD